MISHDLCARGQESVVIASQVLESTHIIDRGSVIRWTRNVTERLQHRNA